MDIRAHYKSAFMIWLHSALFLSLSLTAMAQNKGVAIPTTPTNCEGALANLDMTLVEGQKDKEGSFIIIARLGDGERSQRLNQKRLRDVMSYFRNKGESRVVLASGERAKGLGLVELYVGGELLYVLAFPKNGRIDCRGL